jgi:hypothetical protein
MRGLGGKYFYAVVAGYPNPRALFGRLFGVYSSDTGRKLCELGVDHVVQSGSDAVLYFLPDVKNSRILAVAGDSVVCHPGEFVSSSCVVSSWNLSELANAALAVEMAKCGLCYSWLSSAPLPAEAGLSVVELNSFENSKLPPYGFFDENKKELLINPMLVKGQDEGMPVSLWLNVFNRANGNSAKQFFPEEINADVLRNYIGFSRKLIKTVKRVEVAPNVPVRGIEFIDEVPEISRLLVKPRDFAGFLAYGIPPLSDLFAKYGLPCPRVTREEFARLRPTCRKGISSCISFEKIESLAIRAKTLVDNVIPKSAFSGTCRLRVVSLLLGRARVFSDGSATVFVSADRSGANLAQILSEELIYSYALSAIRPLNLAPKRARYLASGLRVYLSAKLAGVGVAEVLGLTAASHKEMTGRLPLLKRRVEEHINGNYCNLYDGKYHRYFKPKPLESLPAPVEEQFLAACEIAEGVKTGRIYECILP